MNRHDHRPSLGEFQLLPIFEEVFPRVALLLNYLRHVFDRKVRDLHSLLDLFPRKRHRYGRARPGAGAVSCGDRFAARVLHRINVHLLFLALCQHAFRGRDPWRATRDLAGQGVSNRGNLWELVFGFQRQINVYAGRAGRLWKRRQAEFIKDFFANQGHFQNVLPRRGFRIEIEHQVIRFVQMLDGRVPRMLLDGSQVSEMQERSDRRENGVVEFASFLICETRRLDEGGRALQILLKEHRRLNPARITLEDCRPALQKRHDERFRVKVVAQQFELRNFLAGPIDAIETGERDALALDLQNQIALWFLESEKFFARDRQALALTRAFDAGL